VRRYPAVIAGLLLLGGPLLAQNAPPPSDNPLAGLKIDDPNNPTPDPNAPGPFLAKFKDHLVVLSGDQLKPADPALLDGVKYVAFYYSASWCPPCRAFSPKLVDFYNSFKKSHPNFELIFVNDDNNAEAMLAYMTMDKMPWPAVRFDDIGSPQLDAKKFQGPGIPDLVLVDAKGQVLADSFVQGSYAGPESVIDAIKEKVPAVQTASTAAP
jgi:nucleoredoxin